VKAAKDSHFLEIEAYEITRLADGFKNMPEQPLRSQASQSMDAHPQ